MITPTKIKAKSQSLYRQYVKSWLLNEPDDFPLRVAAKVQYSRTDIAGNLRGVELLRAKSKERLGWGYTLEEEYVASPTMGRSKRPKAVWIETKEDLLKLAGKTHEFKLLVESVEQLRAEFPELEDWWVAHWQQMPKLHHNLDGLIAVVKYFLAHPRPNCFAQQLPVAIGTKFIKEHEKVLTEWLNKVLPPSSVIAHEKKFARRFGLLQSQVFRRTLLLDADLPAELGLPFEEFDVPVRALAALQVKDAVVVIVENRASLESVPRIPRGLVFWGEGMSVREVKEVEWLQTNRVIYWGDIDPAGFQILSALRASVPHVESILMDRATFAMHAQFAMPVKHPEANLLNLTASERAAYQLCHDEKKQVEQEHLTQKWVCDAFAHATQNLVMENFLATS